MLQGQMTAPVTTTTNTSAAAPPPSSTALGLGTVQTKYGTLPVSETGRQVPNNNISHLQRYPDPDTSKYQYEATSGYYFDPTTGLYYDGNSRLFYNADMAKWLYWCNELKTYMPCEEQPSAETANVKEKKEEEKGKKAQDIAREMEQWAKSDNKKKKKITMTLKPKSGLAVITAPTKETPPPPSSGSGTSSVDLAYNMLQKAGTSSTASDEEMEPSTESGESADALIASYIDKANLTCNLCRRKFNSEQQMNKHINVSELHKTNVAQLLGKNSDASEAQDSVQMALKYRDRARERREKFGIDER